MWFSNETYGKKRFLGRRSNSLKNRPAMVLNARMRQRKRVWAYRVGMIIVLAGGLGLAGSLCWVGMCGASEALYSGNTEYTVTNVLIRCDSADLREYVRQQMKLKEGTNLFLIDIAGLQREISKTPSVKSVSVYRYLPGTLDVRIGERMPVARLAGPGERDRCIVVDDDGVVFVARSRSLANSLPWIMGYGQMKLTPGDKMSGLIAHAVKLIETCRTSRAGGAVKIIGVETGDDMLKARLANGPIVSIAWRDQDGGRDLEERLEYLSGILSHRHKQGKPVHTVDLTFENYKEYAPITPL